MSLNFDELQTPFLRQYLEYVDRTEPPRLFHLWAALTCAAACMGRHCYLNTGIGKKLYGNMYMLLVGPPGTRKSTAIDLANSLMRENVDIRYAPDDTGGQRQGLIKALIDTDDTDVDGKESAEFLDPEAISNTHISLNSSVDKHVMFVNASEFGTFIGQNNLDLIRFLGKMWDGEDFTYQLRNSKDTLRDPLLTIAGATTPADIAALMPPEAIGQGLMSRMILVYAPHKEQDVKPSEMSLVTRLKEPLGAVFAKIWYELHGPMVLDPAAVRLVDQLYLQRLDLQDTRFIYYTQRRDTHLRKLALVVAVCSGRMVVKENDVLEAHKILRAAEVQMPDALGEFGLSPVAVARQKMLEYLRHARQSISTVVLWSIMRRDMKLVDFQNSLSELVNANKIAPLDTTAGRSYIYKDTATEQLRQLDDEAFAALLEQVPENDNEVI